MYIRPTTREDTPALVDIFCDAFIDDELFAFQAPYRYQCPVAWRRWGWRKQLFQLARAGAYGFVCVADSSDDFSTPGEVLGYAWWFRKIPKHTNAKSDPYSLSNCSVAASMERLLRSVENKYLEWVCPNPVLSPATTHIVDKAIFSTDLFAPLANVAYWHLSALAVAPKHQGKGIGGRLIDWGIERAKEETAAAPDGHCVPVGLHASGKGRSVYARKGFKLIGWKAPIAEVWSNELNEHPHEEAKVIYERVVKEELTRGGGCAMIWDEPGYWTKQAEAGETQNGGPIDLVWREPAPP